MKKPSLLLLCMIACTVMLLGCSSEKESEIEKKHLAEETKTISLVDIEGRKITLTKKGGTNR